MPLPWGNSPDPERERLMNEAKQTQADKEYITNRLIPGHQAYGMPIEKLLTFLAKQREGGNPFDILESVKQLSHDDPAGSNIIPDEDYNRIRNMEMLQGMMNNSLFKRIIGSGKYPSAPGGGYYLPDSVGKKWIQ